MQEKIDECYCKESVKEAVECITEFVRSAEGKCLPKLVLLTQENCVPCAEEKDLNKKFIEEGIIKVFDIKSPEGKAIIAKNKVEAVPSLLLLDCEDKIILPSD